MKRPLVSNLNNVANENVMMEDLNLNEVFQTFNAAMRCSNMELKRSALSMICRVVRIINEDNNIPEEWRWRTFFHLNDVIGPGTTLHRQFDDFCHTLMNNLQENARTVSENLVALVISLLRTSLPLLKPQAINELQTMVCTRALSFQPEPCDLQILNALLQFNHDEVPIPLQVAQTVFNRSFFDESIAFSKEVERGRYLTNIYSKPKIPPIVTRLVSNVTTSIANQHSGPNPQQPQQCTADLPVNQLRLNYPSVIENEMTTLQLEKIDNNEVKDVESDDAESIEILSAGQILSLFEAD